MMDSAIKNRALRVLLAVAVIVSLSLVMGACSKAKNFDITGSWEQVSLTGSRLDGLMSEGRTAEFTSQGNYSGLWWGGGGGSYGVSERDGDYFTLTLHGYDTTYIEGAKVIDGDTFEIQEFGRSVCRLTRIK